MRYEDILALEPYSLIEYLTSEFLTTVPEVIATIEEMNIAQQKLLKLSSSYSYISSLSSYAKIATRHAKRELSKLEYEDMVDKKEIISNALEAVKHQYSAISRAVTIKIENDHELNMASR